MMAASSRRVGAETSKTRDALLVCVEKLMLEEGYASVSYRSLAASAGVTPSLVQYYFPSLDDIFLAAIRRYAERNLAVLEKALATRTKDPLRAMWEYSGDDATSALMIEFMALANHRKSIRAEIAEVTERVRAVQLKALTAKYGAEARPDGQLSLAALLLIVTGFPKFLNLEESVGVTATHKEAIRAFEVYLDRVEPAATPRRRQPSRRSPAKKS
ncbi:TetR family transcriptional regulator [Mycobacterium paraintracellulare]|nr:TetR family transcriptional regulator [Mycobacterium paraintracellulare]